VLGVGLGVLVWPIYDIDRFIHCEIDMLCTGCIIRHVDRFCCTCPFVPYDKCYVLGAGCRLGVLGAGCWVCHSLDLLRCWVFFVSFVVHPHDTLGVVWCQIVHLADLHDFIRQMAYFLIRARDRIYAPGVRGVRGVATPSTDPGAGSGAGSGVFAFRIIIKCDRNAKCKIHEKKCVFA